MDQEKMRGMLEDFKNGKISEDEILLKIKEAPFEDLGFAKIDSHRAIRQGIAEVIYGAGKTPGQILDIALAANKKGQETILITRMSPEAAELLSKHKELNLDYDELSSIGICGKLPAKNGRGKIAIVTGGTSDMPVAEEAARCAEAFGNEVDRIYDVGVAGLHRLLANLDRIMEAKVVIAIAGMEGALASVVGGLVDVPVLAVPTSVGYGASFNGLSALLSMLNSCASGVSVVNIDNGFGAAYQASMINHIK
ncbi:MAG: nickel pincer cofactor biosynthesis protein LarB [Lachnospiraceae bacterium]|nr:nickel pincer cofactor biosynthesis protein LarB [Lachnospiraceae bacterium]